MYQLRVMQIKQTASILHVRKTSSGVKHFPIRTVINVFYNNKQKKVK